MAFCTRFVDENCAICRTVKLGALPTVAAGSAPARKRVEGGLTALFYHFSHLLDHAIQTGAAIAVRIF